MKKALVVLALLAMALPASAAFREGTSEFELFAGSHLGDTFTLDLGSGSTLKMEVDDSVLLGMRGSYFFTDNIAIEMTMAGTQSETWEGRDFDIYYFQGNFTFQFGKAAFAPFFTIGLGAAILDHPTLDNEWNWRQTTDTNFAWNMGGGFKIYFSPGFAFRADIRAYWILTSEQDYWDDDCWDHDCDTWSDSLDTTEISAGFVFRF
jgi:outer membrane protein W